MKVSIDLFSLSSIPVITTGCYGIPEEEDHIRENGSDLSSFTTVPWFCDTCKAGLKSSLTVWSSQ